MNLCRRLVLEFMHAVIAAKALRKVFISIKGFYFQAELKGQLITWIMPHQFGFEVNKQTLKKLNEINVHNYLLVFRRSFFFSNLLIT